MSPRILQGLVPLLLLVAPARAEEPPAITVPVVDLAHVLSGPATDTITAELVALRARTGVQMAVLTVDTTNGVPIDDYALAVFQKWGGGSATRNDGALLVLAVKDRRNRLQLGYGLEPVITDATAAELLVAMRDDLRAGEVGDAIAGLVGAVSARLSHLTPEAAIAAAPPRPAQRPGLFFLILLLACGLGVVSELLAPPAAKSGAKPRRLPVVSNKLRHRVLFAVLPGVVFIVIALTSGFGFGIAYLVGWYIFSGFGLLITEICRKRGLRRVIFSLVFASLLGVFVFNFPTELLADGVTAGVIAVAIGLVLYFLAGMFLADGSGRTGSSYSSSSSSYRSSSSYSSSSSSSHSRSSSSSSWSGGGGSSGGGGASSSW